MYVLEINLMEQSLSLKIQQRSHEINIAYEFVNNET
jgi:hypothetical protein